MSDPAIKDIVAMSNALYEPGDQTIDELVNHPALLILANRIAKDPDPEFYRQLRDVTTRDEFGDLLIRQYVFSMGRRSEVLQTLLNSDITPKDITSFIASVISGKSSPNDLAGYGNRVKKLIESEIKKQNRENVKSNVSNDFHHSDSVKQGVRSKIFGTLGWIVMSSCLIGVAWLYAGIRSESIYANSRRDFMRPVYDQILAAQPSEELPPITEAITLGINSKVISVDYQILPNSDEANYLYVEAMNMPDSMDNQGTTIDPELLSEKIDAFQQIILMHPGTVEAYSSQYEIYITKYFNQNLFSAEEIVDEQTTLLLDYPKISAWSTKNLLDLVIDNFNVQQYHNPKNAHDLTEEWIKDIIKQAPGTNLAFKMNYVLASIYAGQAELLSVAEEDKISVLRLPEDLVGAYAIDQDEIVDIYRASAHGNPFRASIAHYSIAHLMLKDMGWDQEGAVFEYEDVIAVAGHLEESIALTTGYEPFQKYWAAQAYYTLAELATGIENYDYAKELLGSLTQEFPNEELVTLGKVSELNTYIDEQKATAEQRELEEYEKGFNEWFGQTEKDA